MNTGPRGKTRQKYQHLSVVSQIQMPSPNLLLPNLNLEQLARMFVTSPLLRGGKLALPLALTVPHTRKHKKWALTCRGYQRGISNVWCKLKKTKKQNKTKKTLHQMLAFLVLLKLSIEYHSYVESSPSIHPAPNMIISPLIQFLIVNSVFWLMQRTIYRVLFA